MTNYTNGEIVPNYKHPDLWCVSLSSGIHLVFMHTGILCPILHWDHWKISMDRWRCQSSKLITVWQLFYSLSIPLAYVSQPKAFVGVEAHHYSPSTLRTWVRHIMCSQPCGRKVLCKYVWISHRRVYNGSMLKIEHNKFLMMMWRSTSLTDDVPRSHSGWSIPTCLWIQWLNDWMGL
jgi:hypothetical protein